MNPTSPAPKTHSEIVYAALPERGGEPIRVHALAYRLPLTLPEVSAALQELKRVGLAVNPRGRKTNSWTRDVPVAPEPEPEPDLDSAADEGIDDRVHEVERHLARIEGALAGMSSKLDDVLRLLAESAEREKIVVGNTTPKEAVR